MTWQGWLQIALFAALITAVVKPLGGLHRAQRRWLRQGAACPGADRERPVSRWPASIRRKSRAGSTYALALLWFHLAGIVALYALQRVQNLLPLNPQQFDAVAPDLALNTAVSFATNTSWQSYGGETTLSYLVADGGDHRPVVPLRRDRRRRGDRAGAWLRAPLGADDRQFLGRSDADHALCAAADLRRRRAVPGLAGRAADARRLCQRDDAGRRQSGSGARAGRVAGGDQAAERRWRRLLQCQLGASVRESDCPRPACSRCC